MPSGEGFLGQGFRLWLDRCPRNRWRLVRLDVVVETMGMAVDLGAVVVAVLVDEVDVEQELPVGEDVRRCSFSDDAMFLGEDEATIGEQVEGVEVMGGEHDGLAATVEFDDELHQ